MSRTCQNCRQDFTIYPEDFEFYEKVKVPPPTFCSFCRAQRRLAWRNERGLYKRKSNMSGDEIFSMFPDGTPFPVYTHEEWWSDAWDPFEFGQDYDFSRSFFEQFNGLKSRVPRLARSFIRMINSDYSNNAEGLKNCYLLFNANFSEDCSYGNGVDRSHDCVDNSHLRESELSYDCFWMTKCSRAFYSSQCEECVDIWFSKNLRGCTNCFGCMNLRNKNYCIFNKEYPREEYEKRVAGMDLGSREGVEKARKEVSEFFLKFPNKFIEGIRNSDVSGAYVSHSQNVHDSYLVREGKDLRYCQYMQVPTNEDCYDHTVWGKNNVLTYECAVCGDGANNIKFCAECYSQVKNLEYCIWCITSSDLFGCVGMRNKRYCVFNKQYSKEEYEELTARIREQMREVPYVDRKGREYRYGEFFPIEISDFGYNETIAPEHFPLTEDETEEEGFSWHEEERKGYDITMEAGSVPGTIGEVTEDILKETIGCMHKGECNDGCTVAFRLIPHEFHFYKRFNIPIPILCPNCRHGERLKQRNSFRLWERKCDCGGGRSANGTYENIGTHEHGKEACSTMFQTSYEPRRPEIVYCEECYQGEVV